MKNKSDTEKHLNTRSVAKNLTTSVGTWSMGKRFHTRHRETFEHEISCKESHNIRGNMVDGKTLSQNIYFPSHYSGF